MAGLKGVPGTGRSYIACICSEADAFGIGVGSLATVLRGPNVFRLRFDEPPDRRISVIQRNFVRISLNVVCVNKARQKPCDISASSTDDNANPRPRCPPLAECRS